MEFNFRRCGIEYEFNINNKIKKNVLISKINKKLGKKIKSTQHVVNINNNFWNLKTDSTCGNMGHLKRDLGLELVSPVLENEDCLNSIKFISSILLDMNCSVNKNCGLHVHVEALDINSYEKVINFLFNWIKLEPIMKLLVPEYRTTNKHCVFWIDQYKDIISEFDYNGFIYNDYSSIIKLFFPKSLLLINNSFRKMSLNIVNICSSISNLYYKKRPTMEYRFPDMNLNIDNVFWILFFIQVTNSLAIKNKPQNLIPITNITEWLDFIGLGINCNPKLFEVRKTILQKIYFNSFIRNKQYLLELDKIIGEIIDD